MNTATDLDSAVDALLADDTPATDNLDEAVDALLEPEGDTQQDGEEEADESQDDLDAPEDELDATDDGEEGADTDDKDEDDEPVEATLFPVKIDGKEEQWTLEQLKQSAAGQGYINKQMQDQATQRKELEASVAQLAQERQAVYEAFQRLQSGENLTAPTPPSEDLFDRDPIGYMSEEIAYKKKLVEFEKSKETFGQVNQQKEQAAKQQSAIYLKEQFETLSQHIPEFISPDTRKDLIEAINKAGVEHYDFTAEELGGITDNRMIRALNDARKYREIQAKREIADAKTKDARPMVKAGAKATPKSSATLARQKAQARLAQTGKIDDAVSLLFK